MKRERIILSVAAATVLVLSGCSNKIESGDDTEGEFTIEQTGGNSSEGVGGHASNTISITSYGASVRIENTGTVDTNFTVPANTHETYLGDYGATFEVDTQIPLLSSGTPAEDTYFTTVDIPRRMYKSNGDSNLSNDEVVTGIQVNEGVTLALGLNNDTNGQYGDDQASFTFANDIVINGTLKTDDLTKTLNNNPDRRHGSAATSRDKGALHLKSTYGAFIVGANGAVDTSGDDGEAGTDERGGDGGAIRVALMDAQPIRIEGRIDASGGNGDDDYVGGDAAIVSGGGQASISLKSSNGGSFVHTGSNTIDSSGGDGYGGGHAGYINIYTDEDFHNTGKIDASGGNAEELDGGKSAWVEMATDNGSFYNSGDIFAKGGNSGDYEEAKGTDGSQVSFSAWGQNVGQSITMFNSGEINTNGGNGGGSAGNINFDLDVSGGDLRSSGNLYANGGSAGSDRNGGSGGRIYIEYGNYENDVAGNMLITGNIHNNGGIAQEGQGGTAGSTTFRHLSQAEGTHTLSLLGYTAINVSGGDGADAGGIGGFISTSMYEYNGVTSSFYNEVDIYGHGGDATSDGQGGNGGSFSTGSASGDTQNSGSLYFNGGASTGMSSNSNGGNVYIDRYENADTVSNTADMITVEAGTGGTAGTGTNGTIIIAGTDETPPDGTLP